MRKGSALLIVLGMLSFMVISAVGFSMYMRQSRAPSSYLRRNVAARYLVKAALANAIEELEGGYNEDPYWGIRDNERSGNSSQQNNSTYLPNCFYGIFDDPYPGCGPDNQYAGTDVKKNGDYWLKRVFCPFGPVREPTSESDAEDPELQNLTVPTLTLEALAYLPPAIADDVRKVSRLTRTACWRPLPYEAGRYAYCAVNVSDLFDVNRLLTEPRNSSPNGRISLVSLAGTSATSPTAIGSESALRTAVEKWTQSSVDTPYVSLADFALMNANTDYSPFTRFVGTSNGQLLGGNPPAEANALFITDTWFPFAPTNGIAYDLASGHQPFLPNAFGTSPAAGNFLEVLLQKNTQDNVGDIFEKNLGTGLACLYDYLDRDQQPISLCIPSVEAVPMVMGVSAPAGLQVTVGNIGAAVSQNCTPAINGTVPNPNGGTTPATAQVKRDCQLKGITSFGSQAHLTVLAAYPFKRMATTGRWKTTFKIRAMMRICLASDGLRSRLGSSAMIKSPVTGDWPLGGNGGNPTAVNGVATFFSDTKSLSDFSSDVETWDKAVSSTPIDLQFSNLNVEMPLYWEVNETVDASTVTPSGIFTPSTPADVRGTFNSLGNLSQDTRALRPLDVNGNVHADWTANGPWNLGTVGANGVADMTSVPVAVNQTKFRFQVAVWLQVLDGNEVVDMAPACYNDDNEWLGAGLPGANDVVNKMGDGVPLLNFAAKDDVDYGNVGSLASAIAWDKCATLYAVDPRYNWAPEDWYATDDLAVDKTKWHDVLESQLWGQNGRDRDIFMFVSDQEYLQDIGELQFLPYLQEMNGSGAFLTGDYAPNYNGNPFAQRKNAATTADFANGGRFWRTYTAYDNGDGYDPIYALPYNGSGIRITSGGSGFRLNPYSDDDRVLFAALVGTPFDYYVASTNTDTQVRSSRCQNIDLNQMMSTFSFGRSSIAELTDQELTAIGDRIRGVFQDAANDGDADWEAAWEDLMQRNQWQDVGQKCDENVKFLGETLGQALHGVDRKYLASFWRECFANRQQLFLMFVRAEPTSIGGGASGGNSSAQLGGRAVALVWRDPAVPTYNRSQRGERDDYRNRSDSVKEDFRKMKKNCPSHRTRILFYHQFD